METSSTSFTFAPPPSPPGLEGHQTFRTHGSVDSSFVPRPRKPFRYDNFDESPDIDSPVTSSWEMGHTEEFLPQLLAGGPSPEHNLKKGPDKKRESQEKGSSLGAAGAAKGGDKKPGKDGVAEQQVARAESGEAGTSTGPELDEIIEGMGGQVDVASYLLGERVALEKAFSQVIPQRQQLGHLEASIAHLQSWTQQDSARLRRLESAGSGLHVAVGGASERLQALEQRVPEVESGLLVAQSHLAQMARLVEELNTLKVSQAALAARHNQLQELTAKSWGSYRGGVLGFLEAIAKQLAGYASKADVFFLAFARKVILDEGALPLAVQPLNPPGGDLSLSQQTLLHAAQYRRLRAALGAVLLVTSVETVYRLQRRLRRPLPGMFKAMTSPLEYGLRTARLCVWASALLVGVQEVKRDCFAAVDALLRLHKQLQKRGLISRPPEEEESESSSPRNCTGPPPRVVDMV